MTSTGEPYPQLTLFAADTPANHSASPAQETAQTTHDTSGHVSPTAFAYFDHDSRCWKTLQGTFLSDSEMSKPTWPRSGTTQNGIAYQRQPSAPRTSATEFSLSLHGHTWATPTTQEIEHRQMTINDKGRRATKSGHGRGHSIGLADQVRLWPKPTAHITKEGGHPSEGRRNTPTLTFQAMWPTPTYGKLSGGSAAVNNIKAKHQAGQITEEEMKAMQAGNGGKLNPEWVEWLMGFPIGWTDLEDSETP